ncbi:MAG: DNA primase DnaG [Ktedonobacterales bacterium]|jgi:DNA primase|nr:MAG: DNA primase DnaG [Ktedonobacterales bacterium]
MAETSGNIFERIKRKLDIVEEIGAVVPLKKSGKAFKGLCPFHGERTPSFYVFPEKAQWRCYGCHESGDIFTFVEKQQGLDFRDALVLLAERAGIALESGFGDGAAEESAETSARKRLRALNEAAAIWFHHQLLQSAEAQYARTYLDSRGVNGDSLALWRLGFAPDGDRLSAYLLEQAYTAKELVDAGLAREREASRGGGLYDYFRNRIIFPIRDARGQTVAFGGRELGGGQPKYLNTPQTLLFDKSATLYGLDLARQGIKQANQVVIVEGYMDAVVPYQYGFRNVVACIGSAITEKHIRQIKKLTRRVALALDPDAAGESATLRGITVAQEAFDRVVVPVPGPTEGAPRSRKGEPKGMVRFEEQVDAEITVVRLPPHEDPDEFARRDPDGWRQAVAQAQPLIDFLIEAQTADLDLAAPHGKIEATRRLLPVIAELRERTIADEYVGRLAERVRLDKVELARDLAELRQRLAREGRTRQASRDADGQESDHDQSGAPVDRLGEKYPDSGQSGPVPSYSATAHVRGGGGTAARLLAERAQEEDCLGLLLEHPEVWAEVYGILTESDFASTDIRALYVAFTSALQVSPALDAQHFLDELPAVLQEAAVRARARVAVGTPEEGPNLAKAAGVSAYRLKRTRLKEEMAELDYLQRDAERSGDLDALRGLLARKQQVLSQRRALDAASGLHG